MINKIINEIKNQEINISSWIFGFTGIILVRLILESISSPSLDRVAYTDTFSILHIGLYFLGVTLGTILIFGSFSENYKASSKYVLFGLPLIWLAPILDIVLSGGRGYKMLYLFDTGKNILINFLTFFGPSLYRGATIGIRVGIFISLVGLGYLLWVETKSIKKVLFSTLSIYIFVFIMASIPGILYTTTHKFSTVNQTDVVLYFENLTKVSTVSHNSIRGGLESVTREQLIEIGFTKILSQIIFIISIIISSIILYKIDKNKFKAILKNIRIERVNFYTASLMCGIGFAYINGLGKSIVWVDAFGFLSLIIAWIALWMYAVHTNDIYDLDIDKISNKNRPLVKMDVTKEEMRDYGMVWLIIALLGSWCAGFYPFFMALVYISCSYIYSTPPLRLRRFPLIPAFLIGVACLATVFAGFFFVSTSKQMDTFPIFLSLGIITMVTLAINFKDIKDIEGDRAQGILTIPTLFPTHGVKIVAILFALSILLVPIFLSFYLLYIFAIPSSFVSYRIITKKPYDEKKIFTLRFFFLGAIALSYLFAYWYVGVYNP
ncbi:MAG TPA: UbiA family prenyltransferase [Parcubacteria group bacterium]|jgi:4-hydroxybenzoate polyprenyltransferase|nr:UbiA family prenyltransferase [Parcubacteria group bacterium]